MDVILLYFDGCPNWQTTAAHLAGLAGELDLRIRLRRVETPEEAAATGFLGSPTVLVDGRDPFASGGEPVGLACRIYRTLDGPQGSPTVEQLRQALSGPGEATDRTSDQDGDDMESEQADTPEESPDPQAVHDALLDVAGAVQEHFGDREPSEDELRAFLRHRLIEQGRSEPEVEAIMRDL